MKDNKRFDSVLYAVSDRTKNILEKLSPTVKANTCEIRMRLDLPLAITVGSETVFIRENGQTQFFLSDGLFMITKSDLEESFKKLCNNSVFAHEDELKNGFVIMKNGNRAGICGTLSTAGTIRDISSVNLRIAREINGSANEIVRNYKNSGLLIAGPPGSGKTTVLRDFIRQVSNGNCGRLRRVSVIDSRCEISGSCLGKSLNDLGANTDVIITENKSEGIEIALRTMFPDIIAFDEIGTADELKSVSESFCSGVNIVTTAHAGSINELKYRSVTNSLLTSQAINQVAFLPNIHGGKITVFDTKELFCEAVV